MKQRWTFFLLTAFCFGLFLHPHAVKAQFGELPSGPVSRSKMGTADEIVLNIIFDPSIAQDQLPPGLRLRTLEEVAKRLDSPALFDYLQAHPEHRGWCYSYLEIIRPASLEYDGYRANLGKRGGMAIWYAYCGRTDQDDQRPKGSQLLALGTWLSDRKLVALMQEKGYPAEYADIELRQDRRGLVSGSLKNAQLEVHGQCRLVGGFYQPDFGHPPFLQTIWTPRSVAATFEIVTFYGHAQRKCTEAVWKVDGTHRLATAYRTRAEGGPEVTGTDFYAHYVLRGALYRR